MAARLNLRQTEQARAAIQTTQIIKRFQKHTLGEIEMTPTQIRTGEVLLKKTIPDLSSVSFEGDNRLTIEIRHFDDSETSGK